MKKPIIGITMGDPAGNGSEISVKALSRSEIYEQCRPVIIGDAACMEEAVKIAGKEGQIKIHAINDIKAAKFEYGTIDVYDMNLVNMDRHIFGKVSKMCGEAAFQYVVKVIELAHEDLRVVHVSTHVSLRQACDKVKKDRVLEVIRIANDACKAIGIENPKIGVAGLNPHCGENGLFGTEEIEEIQPAIDEAMAEGINIPEKKPTPPDSIFSKAIGGWYDIVVAMYHDQGHIPLKVKGFVYNKELKKWDAVAGVNVTLGIPVIRVSVDHGTGFDLAGKGESNELSLVNSIDYATKLAVNKK